MSNAIPGPGFLLQKNDGLGNWTTIAEVKDINPVTATTADVLDVTNQSSPGSYEEVVVTILRSGNTQFTVNFLPYDPTHDTITGLQYDRDSKTLRQFRLIIPNQPGGSVMPHWYAYVTQFQIEAPVAGVLTGTVQCKITGKPTWQVPA